MYTASSLSPLSLSLSEVLVSDSSPLLPAKKLPSDSLPSYNVHFEQVLKIVVGMILVIVGVVVVVVVFLRYIRDSTLSMPFVLSVS